MTSQDELAVKGLEAYQKARAKLKAAQTAQPAAPAPIEPQAPPQPTPVNPETNPGQSGADQANTRARQSGGAMSLRFIRNFQTDVIRPNSSLLGWDTATLTEMVERLDAILGFIRHEVQRRTKNADENKG
jgi:hypothetical protein